MDAYLDAGDKMAAEAALDQATTLAADPEQQAQVLVPRVRLAPDDGHPNRALAERAFRLAPAGGEVRAETLRMLGECHRHHGHGRLAWRLTQRAVTAAAEVRRFDVQLEALNERLMIERLWGLGQGKQTMREIERLIDTELNLPIAEWAWTKSFFAP